MGGVSVASCPWLGCAAPSAHGHAHVLVSSCSCVVGGLTHLRGEGL